MTLLTALIGNFAYRIQDIKHASVLGQLCVWVRTSHCEGDTDRLRAGSRAVN